MSSHRATKQSRLARMFALLGVLALFVAACGEDDSEVTPDEGVDEDAAEVDPGLDDETGVDDEEDAGQEEQGVAEEAMYQADLEALNDSGVDGTVTIEATSEGMVTVSIETTGYVGGNPHAQHFHIGGENECPDEEMSGDDEYLTTAEGVPAYGEVQVSLTTEGAVDAASALAVERFPVASDDGAVAYERTFELPSGVTADDLEDVVVVQHGIASLFGDEAAYDGDMMSSLDDTLPLEATIPAACAAIDA